MRIVLLLALIAALAACATPRPAQFASRSVATAPQFGDDKPHPWAGPAPWHYAVHGIDVSRYQGRIDWDAVRTSGIRFAYLKATEGGDFLDPSFAANWEGARRAGMKRGAYHYYYFCRSAREQALWFTHNVPTERASLPPVLDMEWTPESRTCRLRPAPAQVRAEMQRFLTQVERHFGRRPIVYSTVDFYRENALWLVDGYDFWLRSVANHPEATYPGQPWSFWQYTGTGRVPGIAGHTDLNAFAGSPAEWDRWLRANAG